VNARDEAVEQIVRAYGRHLSGDSSLAHLRRTVVEIVEKSLKRMSVARANRRVGRHRYNSFAELGLAPPKLSRRQETRLFMFTDLLVRRQWIKSIAAKKVSAELDAVFDEAVEAA
jgi:hypothetical protein